MPFIKCNNSEVKRWTGMHLFHSALSSCSQRVRIALSEKNLEWESHILDLAANEHANNWYQSINPEGLVPTLVVDGRVIIESIDIIDWLDQTFPAPPLYPADSDDQSQMKELMTRAERAQPSLKVLSHEFLFKPRRMMDAGKLQEFLLQHNNEELKTFMRNYCSDNGFSRNKIEQELRVQFSEFSNLNKIMADGRTWFLGDQFTLADISWIPNVHRLQLMDYPLYDRHPQLYLWYKRFQERSSYKQGLESQEPSWSLIGFQIYNARRRVEQNDITQYHPLRIP